MTEGVEVRVGEPMDEHRQEVGHLARLADGHQVARRVRIRRTRVRVDRTAARDCTALAHELGGAAANLGSDEVQGAELVVVPHRPQLLKRVRYSAYSSAVGGVRSCSPMRPGRLSPAEQVVPCRAHGLGRGGVRPLLAGGHGRPVPDLPRAPRASPRLPHGPVRRMGFAALRRRVASAVGSRALLDRRRARVPPRPAPSTQRRRARRSGCSARSAASRCSTRRTTPACARR